MTPKLPLCGRAANITGLLEGAQKALSGAIDDLRRATALSGEIEAETETEGIIVGLETVRDYDLIPWDYLPHLGMQLVIDRHGEWQGVAIRGVLVSEIMSAALLGDAEAWWERNKAEVLGSPDPDAFTCGGIYFGAC